MQDSNKAFAHWSTAPVPSRAYSVVMERSVNQSDGASDGARTHDLLITNQGLYQLSYTGLIVDCGGSRGADEAGQREPLAAVPKNSGAVC